MSAPFAQLIQGLVADAERELGDTASVTDGVVTRPAVQGYFRRDWEERLSNVYGFEMETPTFECQLANLADLAITDATLAQQQVRLTFGGVTYKVAELKRDSHINALLVLSR